MINHKENENYNPNEVPRNAHKKKKKKVKLFILSYGLIKFYTTIFSYFIFVSEVSFQTLDRGCSRVMVFEFNPSHFLVLRVLKQESIGIIAKWKLKKNS